jgi:hypothetical protein
MTRLAQAQEILSRATQAPVACPFLAAIPAETRATLETQFPNPHELPETQLQEIAAQHNFPNPVRARHASPLPETSCVIAQSQNVNDITVSQNVNNIAQSQNELEKPVFDYVFLSSVTGWVQATQARIAREVLSYEQEAREVLLWGQEDPPLQNHVGDYANPVVGADPRVCPVPAFKERS